MGGCRFEIENGDLTFAGIDVGKGPFLADPQQVGDGKLPRVIAPIAGSIFLPETSTVPQHF